MATAVVDLVHLAGRRVTFVKDCFGCLIKGICQHRCTLVVILACHVTQRLSQSQELTQRIPTQVVLFLELLNVLRSRSACTRFKESATGDQGHDREHLGGSTQLHDGEEVGEVVTQHVTGHRDGVLATTDTLQGVFGGVDRVHDLNIQTIGIFFFQISLNLGADVVVMRTGLIQPEDSRHTGKASTLNSELDPVMDRDVLGLAGAPDIALGDLVLHEDFTLAVNNLHAAGLRDDERLVVRAVLFGLLGHQANIRNRTHGGWIESAVFAAIVDNRLVDTSVGGIRDDRQGVLSLVILIPHLTGSTDHGRHRSVDNDIRGNMQVSDALIGVHHCKVRPLIKDLIEGCTDFFTIVQLIQACVNGRQTVVTIQTCSQQFLAVLLENVREEGAHCVTEDDWVRNLHHGGLEVYGEEHSGSLRA